MRVLLLHNIVNPHMTPVFQHLAKLVDLKVAYFAESEGDRRWSREEASFDRIILPGRQLNLNLAWDTFSFHFNPGLPRFLRETTFDVLINAGWASPSNWQAFATCKRLGRAQVMWAGSTADQPSLARTLTRPLVQAMVARHDAWVSYGTASSRYLISLGADPARTIASYHCIDNARFLSECEATRGEVSALRNRLGLDGKRVILFVGRLVATKGLVHLVRAFQRIACEIPDAALVLAGDGPIAGELARLAGGDARVVFAGHVPLEFLPAYYQLATVAVLPSLEEVWGLVLNEAALAGLPLVATSTCGAALDLIEDGVNGFVVPPADDAALARALSTVLASPARAAEMGRASATIVEKCTPEGVASAMTRAAELALASRS